MNKEVESLGKASKMLRALLRRKRFGDARLSPRNLLVVQNFRNDPNIIIFQLVFTCRFPSPCRIRHCSNNVARQVGRLVYELHRALGVQHRAARPHRAGKLKLAISPFQERWPVSPFSQSAQAVNASQWCCSRPSGALHWPREGRD